MYIMHVCARVISHSLSLRHLCVFSVHCCFFHHGDCCFHFLLITFSGFTHICAIHIFLFHVLLYRKPCTFLRNIIIWGFPVNFKCSLKTNPLNSVIGHTHFVSGCSLDQQWVEPWDFNQHKLGYNSKLPCLQKTTYNWICTTIAPKLEGSPM